MTSPHDSDVRDLLPDWVAGRLDAKAAERVAGEVDADDDLRAEVELLRQLAATRPVVPAGLEGSVQAAVLEDTPDEESGRARRLGRLPKWALAAAAVAFLVLTADLVQRGDGGEMTDPLSVSFEQSPSPWVSDDGLVGGAPVLAGLTDEELELLLVELGG